MAKYELTLPTSALVESTNVGILSSNITKFYPKSVILQVTVNSEGLKLNHETNGVLTQMFYPTSVEGDTDEFIGFIDSLKFKQILNTFSATNTQVQIDDNGMTLRNGKSKFHLPFIVDVSSVQLRAPHPIEDAEGEVVELENSSWKFVHDYQLFACTKSFIQPQYVRLWVGDDSTVLTGDFQRGIFTKSYNSNLDTTCLLSTGVINVFSGFPDNTQIAKVDIKGSSYTLQYVADGYTVSAECYVEFESDLGDYNAPIILTKFIDSVDSPFVLVMTDEIKKFLSQATILSDNLDNDIRLTIRDKQMILSTSKSELTVDVVNSDMSCEADFDLSVFKSAVAHMVDSEIYISPIYSGDSESVDGITLWDDSISIVIATKN